MKIVIVSDSHGELELLNKIKTTEYDADLFIHCGDYCLPEYLITGWAHVRGNCDYSFDAPQFLDIPSDFGIIHVEHGDNYYNVLNIDDFCKRKNISLVFLGHTHIRKAIKKKNYYIFNPGSLTRPRDNKKGSYLIINIKNSIKDLTYKFKEINV